jgi:hypothetical protein
VAAEGFRGLLRHAGGFAFTGWILAFAPVALPAPLQPAAVSSADGTPPVITPSIQGTLGLNGWYVSNVTVAWSVTDPESGIIETRGCDTQTLTQDTTRRDVTCSATNGADLSGSYTFTAKLDKTAPTVAAEPTPTRGPDANGWYNRAVTFGFSGTDAMSGIDACPSVTYSGPDGAAASVTGTCRDKAGNTASRAFSLQYDATAPSVTGGVPDRGPDVNGWYNHAVDFRISGSDATSTIDACPMVTYSGPDGGAAAVTGTCRDKAGNVRTRDFPLQYDATRPTVTGASPARSPDVNGWYNQPVALTFAGTDSTSGIDACDRVVYEAPDSATASAAGTCKDRAGNRSAVGSASLKYDATDPTVTRMDPTRLPDSNSWYNGPVPFSLTGSDTTSGIDACPTVTYSGPDSDAASAVGTCRDKAGNTATRTQSLKYDATAPLVSASADRAPNAAGWYNRMVVVSFSGTDAVSRVESCAQPVSYSGPDTGGTSVDGTCRDFAGNIGSRSFPLKYDATDPTVMSATPGRGADTNGWYNQPVTFSFTGSDAPAGIEACPAVTYEGPDGNAASVTGVCRDRAGNTAARGFPLKYDATRPAVRATPDRPPNANGWYNRAVVVSFDGSDPASGIDTCGQAVQYAGPDAEAASVAGTCRDLAGNVGSGTFALKFDGTAPRVTSVTAARGPDSNGWYNHPIAFSLAGVDATSGVDSCEKPTYAGPDSTGASVTGVCRDHAGNSSGPGSATFMYDATDPTVTGITPERPPDANGWYNHPVAFSLTGTDATSKLDSCTSGRYEGPDRRGAPAPGVCRDNAGNEAAATLSLDYDETAPSVEAVPARRPDRYGWYSRPIRFSFAGSDATSGVTSCSDPILYRAPNSASASVTGGCADVAGNRGTAATTFRYAQPLLLPRPGARVSGPPLLDWVEVPNARRYNVQLWHEGRKILSAWPSATRFKLRWSWRFEGRVYRLEPGLYRVHVWPRIGNRYGFELGRTSFRVRTGST